jgi:hypothetical protein
MSVESVIAAVRSCGNDPRDLRDAAHEACHAIEFGVKRGQWDRETINATLERRAHRTLEAFGGRPMTMGMAEVRARVVERLVCEHLGVAYEPKDWLMTSWMEAFKNSLINFPTDFFETRIAEAYAKPSKRTLAVVEAILALRPHKPRARIVRSDRDIGQVRR